MFTIVRRQVASLRSSDSKQALKALRNRDDLGEER